MEELNKNLQERQLSNAAIKLENQRLKAKYEQKLKENAVDNSVPNSSNIIPKKTFAVLGLIVLSAITYFAYNFFVNSQAATVKVETYIADAGFYSDAANSTRGGAGIEVDQLLVAEKLLVEGKIEEAVKLYEASNPDSLSPTQNINLALAYMKIGQLSKAEAKFDLLNQKQSNFIQEVQYFEILNLVKLGKYDEAKPLMRDIIRKKQYKWKEVNAILHSLH